MQNVHFRFPSVAQKRRLLKLANIPFELKPASLFSVDPQRMLQYNALGTFRLRVVSRNFYGTNCEDFSH